MTQVAPGGFDELVRRTLQQSPFRSHRERNRPRWPGAKRGGRRLPRPKLAVRALAAILVAVVFCALGLVTLLGVSPASDGDSSLPGNTASATTSTSPPEDPSGAQTPVDELTVAAAADPAKRFMTALSHDAVKAGDISKPESLAVVVNKKRPFRDRAYEPKVRRALGTVHELRPEAASALEQMFADADGDGVELSILSAYRSYERQQGSRVAASQSYSGAALDDVSARPGFSEHQSGLAVDIGRPDGKCELKSCFARTSAGKWLANNAHRYGFVVRYPEGERSTTGYVFEPWHLRFIGIEMAEDMRTSGAPTLEDYFGLAPAPSY